MISGGRSAGHAIPTTSRSTRTGWCRRSATASWCCSSPTAILRYLARRHGEETLWPRDVGQAALADQWTSWATTTFYPAVRPLFFATVRTRRAEQDPSSLGPAAERLAPVIAILERALEGRRFLLGEAFTSATSARHRGPASVARAAWRAGGAERGAVA
jgi:hypothetical protein